ncbi:MAG TPA: galactose-1-phosphate uridylyltransferase [Polyangiaceae bacterium]|jgi:UDPglucose--hexose-1-phosphate uridylyltransferase
MSAALEMRRIYKRQLRKPDGRSLVLYSHAPIDVLDAPAPGDGTKFAPNPHLRWHPLRGEWVVCASAKPRDPAIAAEVPRAGWDIAVYEDRFPTFFGGAHDAPRTIVPTEPARGVSEVVVYGQESKPLGALPLWNVELLVDVWADRTHELGLRQDVAYVHVFENRAVEQRPHGQIHAYPFVPQDVARELGEQQAYYARTGRGLLADYVARELADGRRIVYAGSRVVAFVPACARSPYETWIVPLKPSPRLSDLGARDRMDLSRALKTVLLRLDGVCGRPTPYSMSIHQAPADGATHLEAHVHIEIHPGHDLAGVSTAQALPEQKAQELRRIEVILE